MSFCKGNFDSCRINYYSIPDENFEDHSAPPSPEEKDSGFFMLRKDSERRATLHRILTEDQDKVVRNLMETLAQVKTSYGSFISQSLHILIVSYPLGTVTSDVETRVPIMVKQTFPGREERQVPNEESTFLDISFFFNQ